MPMAVTQMMLVAATFLVWQVLSITSVLPTSAVAAPIDIVSTLGTLVETSEFWSVVVDTILIWAAGLVLAIAIAVPLGFALGSSDLLYRLTRMTIDFLRTIPPVALLPLCLLLYGATPRMALTLAVFGSVWPLILQCMYGVHQVDPLSYEVARSYGVRRRDRVLRIVLPSAAPFMATGIRIAATMSLLLVVGASLFGGSPGAGTAIAAAQADENVPKMYAYIVTTAFLGVALNLALMAAERAVLAWHPSQRMEATA